MNLTLKNVAEFERPAGAMDDDPQVGADELGQPLYLNRMTGAKYSIRLAEDQRTTRQKIEDFNFRMPTLKEVGSFLYNTAAGTWEVIDTPRAIAAGEKQPTLGDAYAVGGMAATSTLPFSVPSGSTRIFGGLSGDPKSSAYQGVDEYLQNFDKGFSPEENFLKTGWYYDPVDNVHKYEINDHSAKLKFDPNSDSRPQEKLSALLDHSELYSFYPDLEDVPVAFTSDGLLGSFHPNDGITLDLNAIKADLSESPFKSFDDYVKAVLLHEIQHWVQNKEGFVGKGANPEEPAVKNRAYNDAVEALNEGYIYPSEFDGYLETAAYSFYNQEKGEIDARNVVARLAKPDLKFTIPLKTEDIPTVLQMVRSSREGKPYLRYIMEEK
jgi:hypothetical protein